MSTTINFRIPEEQKEDLQILADERCVKISVIIREIISEYLWEIECLNPDNEQVEVILDVPQIKGMQDFDYNQESHPSLRGWNLEEVKLIHVPSHRDLEK